MVCSPVRVQGAERLRTGAPAPGPLWVISQVLPLLPTHLYKPHPIPGGKGLSFRQLLLPRILMPLHLSEAYSPRMECSALATREDKKTQRVDM